jgi:hypothetical protein
MTEESELRVSIHPIFTSGEFTELRESWMLVAVPEVSPRAKPSLPEIAKPPWASMCLLSAA